MKIQLTVRTSDVSRLPEGVTSAFHSADTEDGLRTLVCENGTHVRIYTDALVQAEIPFFGSHGPNEDLGDRIFAFFPKSQVSAVFIDTDVEHRPVLPVYYLRDAEAVNELRSDLLAYSAVVSSLRGDAGRREITGLEELLADCVSLSKLHSNLKTD